MNNKFNKILAIVLCLVMAIGSVAAVVEGDPTPSPVPTGAPVTTEAPVETAVPSVPPVAESPAPSEVPAADTPTCTCPDVEGVDKTAEDYVHAKDCPLYVPVCTCEGTEEEKAAEGFVHAEGCDFYVAPVDPNAELYEKLMATTTAEEFLALVEGMSEEDEKAFSDSLSAEQLEALRAHIQEIAPAEEATPPQTVTFTDAGPFMPPVAVQTVRRLLRSAPNLLAKEQDNGLVTTKTATLNPDGTYTISIESYTTGTVTTSTKTTPVDIVLVLDQSGSMCFSFAGDKNGSNERQTAMKQAVNNFISAVNEKYSNDADHRMALVTFGSGASTLLGWTAVDDAGKEALQGAINGLPESPAGATDVAAGMGEAVALMGDRYNYTGANTSRQKVVIVFTDGVPTTSSDFDVDVADAAINTAKSMKDKGVTVYSIGIFSGANPNELYGASGFNTNSDGTINSQWIKDTWGLFPGTDFPEADRPAGNRFLNYLSSNYSAAGSVGLTRVTSGLGVFHYKITYKIIENFDRTANGYYLTASDSASLNQIFQTISENIQTPTISLGSETVVKDIVSPYFTIPSNTSDVKVYVADATSASGATWATREETDLTPDVNGSTIIVSGFDFNENFVSDKAKEDGSFGKKLIIEFNVTRKEGFLGGNAVPTNGTESGVYDKDGTLVEAFDIPTVDLPIHYRFSTTDQTIYLGEKADLTRLSSSDIVPDGNNNAYVNISYTVTDPEGKPVGTMTIPAGQTSGEWTWTPDAAPALEKDTKYTINCVVSPSIPKVDGVANWEETKSATVYVRTCTLTITKQGSQDDNQGFIFKVTGPKAFTVSVQGNRSVTIAGLPIGSYTVTEDGWSWRYSADGEKTAELTPTAPAGSVTVNNALQNPYLLDGSAYAQNNAAKPAAKG